MPSAAMEYSDGQMEMYITESGNRKIMMVMDMKSGQMAMNIAESLRIT
jgi:hypothetical protein